MTFDMAWIGYDSVWHKNRHTITASGSTSGTFPQNVGTWPLFEMWMPPSIAESWVMVDCGVPTLTNYLGLAGHNFGTASALMVYEGSNDSAGPWTEIIDFSGAIPPLYDGEFNYDGSITYSEQTGEAVTSNRVLGWLYADVTFRYYRLRVSAAAAVPRIGTIASGVRMDFPIGFYGGHTPADWNDEVEVSDNRADKGIFLGRSIARYGVRDFPISLSPVLHDWVDDVWMPFKRHAQRYPFIFAWGGDPDNNRVYAWAKSWQPAKLKNRKHAEVGVNCEGTSE